MTNLEHAQTENTPKKESPRAKKDDGQMQDLEIDLRNFLLILWRRKILIIFIMLITTGAVYYFVNSVQPSYTSKALVMVENRTDPGPELRALISNMRIDTTLILGEAEVLKSRMLARQVIERLDLMNDPEFNPKLQTQKSGQLKDIFSKKDVPPPETKLFKSFSVYKDEMQGVPPEVADRDVGMVVDRFLKNIYARPIPGSFVLQVEFTSEDAAKSALIANTIVDTYIDQRLDQKFKAAQKLSEWLDERLESLREQVRDSEKAVEQFRTDHNLVSGARAEVTAQQLSELNSQIVLAKSKYAEAQARLRQINDWINHPEKIEATDEAQNSRILQNLKIKEADVLNKIAEMSSRYGDKHPLMINAREELDDIRDQMRQELRRVAKGIEADLRVAQSRIDELEHSLDDVEGVRLTENQANIRLRELTRESESNQVIYDTFLTTYKRSDEREKLQEPEARVISYATIPRTPSYPNKPLFLSLALAASFFVGIALALLLEKLDNAYKTSLQLENETGYPCFGVVPLAEKLDKKKPIGDYILGKPASNVAEAIRTLRMVLKLRSKDPQKPSKVITVTSSLPNEGKTTLSSWMARLAAKSGEKVIVIDCDLRRPRLNQAFGKEPQNTLVEYLTGRATLEETVARDPASGAHIIYARSVPNNALDLLSKPRMKNLINSLRETYDLVILDTPACLAVSDARLLASQSDQTLFAVSWDDTPREVVNAGVKQFADFGYDTLAFVLTNVDIRRHSKYGYGDAVYYYSRYKQYYTD
ncbi:MAG TPA: polysaccharide biosynthesis tyrosine autokinase [Alphaproteobacteria bacterium]|nr:polysaccharide biosynthesis tyrosine autokinase [Alphaproteobacteria bacterium]